MGTCIPHEHTNIHTALFKHIYTYAWMYTHVLTHTCLHTPPLSVSESLLTHRQWMEPTET